MPANSPHKHVAPKYGAKAQYVKPARISPLLDKEQKKYVQAVTGTLLYYARAVDPTILIALSDCNTTGSTYAEHIGRGEAGVRLLHQLRRGNNNLPCKQNDFGSS